MAKEHTANCATNIPFPGGGPCNCGGVLRSDPKRPDAPDDPLEALITEMTERYATEVRTYGQAIKRLLAPHDAQVEVRARLAALREFKQAHDLGYVPAMGQFTAYHDYADIGTNRSEKILDEMIARFEASARPSSEGKK